MRSETQSMTCDRCGEPFRGNPRSQPLGQQYCSIACEEGRTPLPDSDPASDRFWAHVRSNPGSLINHYLVADGLKRTCYSPDWHRDPEDMSNLQLVDVDESEEVMVYQTAVVLGRVVDYENGLFIILDEEGAYRTIQSETVVKQLRSHNWWAD